MRQYGRGAKLLINRKDIPNLQLQALEIDEAEVNSVTIECDEDSSPHQNIKRQKNENITSSTSNGEGDEHSTPSTTQSDKQPDHEVSVKAEQMYEDSDEHSTPQQEVQLTISGTEEPAIRGKGPISEDSQ